MPSLMEGWKGVTMKELCRLACPSKQKEADALNSPHLASNRPMRLRTGSMGHVRERCNAEGESGIRVEVRSEIEIKSSDIDSRNKVHRLKQWS